MGTFAFGVLTYYFQPMRKWFLILLYFLGKDGFCQGRYSIVINEVMADPTPVVGLPNAEWLEVKNTGAVPVNLQNWRIGDQTGQSGALPYFILQPDSLLIITSSSQLSSLSVYGPTISVSTFPNLDNDGDIIWLKSSGGMIVHAIHYNTDWYHNAVKNTGGWSLEMIDSKNPCGGISNWNSSINSIGGSPGKKNSVINNNIDTEAPIVLRTFSNDSSSITVLFNEPLDSTTAANKNYYNIEPQIPILSCYVKPPIFDEVVIRFSRAMATDSCYYLSASNLSDCAGNKITRIQKVKAALSSIASKGDISINEILFNPVSGAYDYVEYYNNSSKSFDVSHLYAANKDVNGQLASLSAIQTNSYMLFPNEYIVVTENPENLGLHYLVKDTKNILGLSNLPSLPDDKGSILLLNEYGSIIDEVNYNSNWHYPLLDNTEGVSLERIKPSGPTQDPVNWQSASRSAGFGTPGYQNSQYAEYTDTGNKLITCPQIFSPDNDGLDDIAIINYQMQSAGFNANVGVYNKQGLLVKHLINHQNISVTGHWKWDGLDDNNRELPIGPYIILVDLFNLEGKRIKSKSVVILAKRFN